MLIGLMTVAFAAPAVDNVVTDPPVSVPRGRRSRKRAAASVAPAPEVPEIPAVVEVVEVVEAVEVVEIEVPAAAAVEAKGPTVDLVIALDVSGSMNALLDSARMKLWSVVEQVSRAEPQPEVRVGLFTYGNGDGALEGYIRRELALTEDLDLVSEQMMRLTTSGSEEYVGWVIAEATGQAGWSEADSIRLLFVCGNETANQARTRFDFQRTAEEAVAEGITVNAIYGGADAAGRAEFWPDVARAGGGIYAAIDMNAGTVRLPPAPQDRLLEELNAQLNETYVTVRGGEDGKARQIEADLFSTTLGTTSARIGTKGSGVYKAPSWDLVDGWRAGRVDLSRSELLPAHLHAMSLAERETYVKQLEHSRHQVQARIREVVAERAAWVAAEQEKATAALPTDLGEAINAAVREQLTARGLSFPRG